MKLDDGYIELERYLRVQKYSSNTSSLISHAVLPSIMNNGREPLTVGMLKVSDGELDMFSNETKDSKAFIRKI